MLSRVGLRLCCSPLVVVMSACGFEFKDFQVDCECDELLTLAETIDWVPGQEPSGVFGTREEGLPFEVKITFQDLDEPDTAGQRLNDILADVTTPNREGPDFRAGVGDVTIRTSTGDADLTIRLAFGENHDTPTNVAEEALQPLMELFGTRG